MTIINIGRNDDQTIAIPDPKVSGRHARLTIYSPTDIRLMDVGSTNGTFIYDNGQYKQIAPNKEYRVTPETFVRFGPDTGMHVRTLIPEKKRQEPINRNGDQRNGGQKNGGQKNEEEKIDISALRGISNKYNSTKLELQTTQQSVQGLRGMQVVFILVGSGVGGGLAKILDTGNTFVDNILPWIISVVLVVAGVLILNSYIKKKTRYVMESQQRNEDYYGTKYVCPSCHYSFRGQHYENVLGAGSCPRCHRKFYDSTAG